MLFAGLLDDAAVFPPGLMPLAEAVPAHRRHLASSHAALVGPLVLAAPMLAELGDPGGPLAVSVTAPAGPKQVAAALRDLPDELAVVGAEIAFPQGQPPAEFFADLASLDLSDLVVYVEIPRDDRRAESIARCAAAGYEAKFRTGGVKAELYPDEAELAAGVHAVVRAGVPFKATAGLHHALRNTDPATGFEQHGYLNLLIATAAAQDGADVAAIASVLAERNAEVVAGKVAALDPRVRDTFRSFGTCSIDEPVSELRQLGLINPEGASA